MAPQEIEPCLLSGSLRGRGGQYRYDRADSGHSGERMTATSHFASIYVGFVIRSGVGLLEAANRLHQP